MKKFATILIVLIFNSTLWGQVPQKISYQAVIRNTLNNLVTKTAVGMKISILQGSATGISIYEEIQTPISNDNGLVTIEIGGGTVVLGSFPDINWATSTYFVKIEIDPNGGTNYSISGTTQLLSVPYSLASLYATTAENITNNAITKLAPTTFEQAPTNLLPFSATLNNKVNGRGFSTNVVFEWGLTTDYGNNTMALQNPITGSADIIASINLTVLQPATTYHYRVKATNAVNVTISNDMTFTTGSPVPKNSAISVSYVGVPVTSGYNSNTAALMDVGINDDFYFNGLRDSRGKIFVSHDKGLTVGLLVDFKKMFNVEICHAIKELPDGELLINVFNIDTDNGLSKIHSYLIRSTNHQTNWDYIYIAGTTTRFEFSRYEERDSNNNLTFECCGRMYAGWSFDSWKNYIVITEYGFPGQVQGSSTNNRNNVGYMITGKIYCSTDYGVTFSQIFDYFNTKGITLNTPDNRSGTTAATYSHHMHSCFIDHYTLNSSGQPRIVGITGDKQNRLVISDDLGATWADGRDANGISKIVGIEQSVCGISTPNGYLLGSDNYFNNGIQLVHRAKLIENMTTENLCSAMRDIDLTNTTLNTHKNITYVCGNIFQKNENSPILAVFNPESESWYNAGARGCVVMSIDGGITWKRIFEDSEWGSLRMIQNSMVFQTNDGSIYLSPTQIWGAVSTGIPYQNVGIIYKIKIQA
jgi:hypothetical protein